jgi:nucleoid DNA-binding protein
MASVVLTFAANLTKDLKRLVTEEEGFSLIRKWFGVFPGAKAYIDKTKDDLYRNDKVQTIVGRYRRFGNMRSMTKQDAKRAERQAVNSIIQGTASDIAKSAMLQCEHDPELNSLGVVLLLQIHDELIFECPDDPEVIKKAKKRVEEIMCSPFVQELLVPIPAAAGTGHTMEQRKVTLIEMVEVISLKERIPKTRVKRVLKALFHEVRTVAMSDECVKLLGLGRFEKKVIKPQDDVRKDDAGEGDTEVHTVRRKTWKS